jgi:23S rRNA pseudouridine1911/1915/1917 synthase
MPATKTTWKVGADDHGVRLDKFLAAADRLGSRSKSADAREKGKVFVNDAEVGPRDVRVRLKVGDEVRVWQDRPGSSRRQSFPFKAGDLNILYEDEYLIVLNKPAGLLAVPLERQEDEPSIQQYLERHMRSHGKRKPFVVHRIDRDTSGVVLFAKDGGTQSALKVQFRERTPERVYLAVVYGHPVPESGTWQNHLVWDKKALIQKETSSRDANAVEAISDYTVRETFRVSQESNAAVDLSLIEVRLRTGKRNQIRIQARLRGHTLVGEKRYTFGPDELRPIPFKRQALHAWRLSFRHPADDEVMKIEAPIPPDMKKLIGYLRHGGDTASGLQAQGSGLKAQGSGFKKRSRGRP